jgi:hypothetical protein
MVVGVDLVGVGLKAVAGKYFCLMKIPVKYVGSFVIVSVSAFYVGFYWKQLFYAPLESNVCDALSNSKQNFSVTESSLSFASTSSLSSVTEKIHGGLSHSSESMARSFSYNDQAFANASKLAKLLLTFKRISPTAIEDMYSRVEHKFNEDTQDYSSDFSDEKEVERIVEENNLIPPLEVSCKTTMCKLIFASSDATALLSVSESFVKSKSASFHESLFDSKNGKLVVYLNKLDNESLMIPREDK